MLHIYPLGVSEPDFNADTVGWRRNPPPALCATAAILRPPGIFDRSSSARVIPMSRKTASVHAGSVLITGIISRSAPPLSTANRFGLIKDTPRILNHT